ncbi:MAG: hypothetical protein ACYC5K_07975, partial [Saccharofermentanales bacterium]
MKLVRSVFIKGLSLILFALLLVSCKTSVTPLPTQDLTSGISQASSEAASEAVSETTSHATS